jgi:hypothetical protein
LGTGSWRSLTWITFLWKELKVNGKPLGCETMQSVLGKQNRNFLQITSFFSSKCWIFIVLLFTYCCFVFFCAFLLITLLVHIWTIQGGNFGNSVTLNISPFCGNAIKLTVTS